MSDENSAARSASDVPGLRPSPVITTAMRPSPVKLRYPVGILPMGWMCSPVACSSMSNDMSFHVPTSAPPLPVAGGIAQPLKSAAANSDAPAMRVLLWIRIPMVYLLVGLRKLANDTVSLPATLPLTGRTQTAQPAVGGPVERRVGRHRLAARGFFPPVSALFQSVAWPYLQIQSSKTVTIMSGSL